MRGSVSPVCSRSGKLSRRTVDTAMCSACFLRLSSTSLGRWRPIGKRPAGWWGLVVR